MEVVVTTPTVIRDFEVDAATILKGLGLHLTADGRWKHFGPDRLKDLTWADVGAFIEANYPERCQAPECKMPGHPSRRAEWDFYFQKCRQSVREGRSAGTLFRGDACTVGYAEVPGKLLRALQNDFPEEFGGLNGEHLVEPTDMLKVMERHSVLNFFVVNPSRSAHS